MRKRTFIIALSMLVACLLVIWTADHGGLGYFRHKHLSTAPSPKELFRYLEFPSIVRAGAYHDNELINLLIDEEHVKPQPDVEKRWETVFHWNSSWKDGYGTFYDVLSRDRDQVMAWTHANPETARVYWTETFQFLRSADPVDVMAGRGLVSYWREFDTPDEVRETISQIERDLVRQ